MKKIIIGVLIVLLFVAGYFGQDYFSSNKLKVTVLNDLDEGEVSKIRENKSKLLKYPDAHIDGATFKSAFEKKFDTGQWDLSQKILMSKEYVFLFDEYPDVRSKGVGLPMDVYFYEYLMNDLYGKKIIEAGYLNSNQIQEVIQEFNNRSPRDLIDAYYDIVMEAYVTGNMDNQMFLEWIQATNPFIDLIDEEQENLYYRAFMRTADDFTDYHVYLNAKGKIESLINQIKTDPIEESFHHAIYKYFDEIEKKQTATYTIDKTTFQTGMNPNVYVIPGKFLILNWLQQYETKRAKDEFTDLLKKSERASSTELKANELYYIVTTNDFMNISQIEIVYTFDDDYSQFVYGNNAEKVLEDRVEELGFETDLYSVYKIYFKRDISESRMAEIGRIIDGVLDNYSEIVKPIMISNQVNHYFEIEEGQYFTELEYMFQPMYEVSDISFFIVDYITSDMYYVDGLATSEGILIPEINMGKTKDARNTVHHELMHQIEQFYSYRYSIEARLRTGDFVYLDDRDLSNSAYQRTIETENFSYENSLDQVDAGMTSHYGGVNKHEHLAELWTDLLTDYDLYSESLEENSLLRTNTDELLRYINRILEVIGKEPLEDIEDIKNFDDLL